MKIGLLFVIFGILIMITGTIFHLQGHGVVGPESSFMYYNSEWVDYGLQILVLGLVVCGVGTALLFFRN